MRSSFALTAAMASAVISESTSTVVAMSQISDGQPQAPTSAEWTSSYSYDNPFTSYMTETNSWGVVTGMPSVWTSQPSVVTSQPPVATWQPSISIPSYMTVVVPTTPAFVNSTTPITTVVYSTPHVTTFAVSTVSSVSTPSSTPVEATTTAPAPSIASTGAGVRTFVSGSGAVFAVLGSLFALL